MKNKFGEKYHTVYIKQERALYFIFFKIKIILIIEIFE